MFSRKHTHTHTNKLGKKKKEMVLVVLRDDKLGSDEPRKIQGEKKALINIQG